MFYDLEAASLDVDNFTAVRKYHMCLDSSTPAWTLPDIESSHLVSKCLRPTVVGAEPV